MKNKTKEITIIIVSSIVGILFWWVGPMVFFYWDYGILFGIKQAIEMLFDDKVGAFLLILYGGIIGGLVGRCINLGGLENDIGNTF